MWKFPSSEDLSYDFLRIFLQWGPALWPKAKEHYEEHCVHGQPGDNVTGGVGESVVDNHLCRPHDNHYNQQLQILQAFCEDSFDGDFGQQLKKGLDELLIVKLWKKGATTEVILIVTVQVKDL